MTMAQGDAMDNNAKGELRECVVEGRYVVDPRAVAEAIIRRRTGSAEMARASQMLVSREGHPAAPRIGQH